MRAGIDIVHIPRIKAMLDDPELLGRTFTHSELRDKRPEHLAGIFAAKEAFLKASQVKVSRWDEIEIGSKGKPRIIHSFADRCKSIDLSISHDGDYAVAIVIIP